MPIASLVKLLGHSDLQTTPRYIDHAYPIVRHDFHQTIHALDQYRPATPLAPRTLALPVTSPEPRLVPETLLIGEAVSYSLRLAPI